MNPEDLRFAKTHEWTHATQQDGAKIATIGISAFAVEQLTDLVYLDLPQAGRQVRAGEPIGEVESVKAVSDFYSPVTGEVIQVNGPLAEAPEKLSEDPYGAGWLVRIQMSDESELDALMDYAAYQQQCAEEG